MKVSPSFCLFVALMLLLQQPLAAKNWQGTGTFENMNTSEIWDYIHANLKRNNDANTMQAFSTDLSDYLNGKWAPAWNVVINSVLNAASSDFNDVILYGYAFKNHWLWFNGYADPAITDTTFSFVIWKDYNLPRLEERWNWQWSYQWINHFSESYYIKEGTLNGDPWGLSKSMIDNIEGNTAFSVANNHAYSIVMAQPFQSSKMYGRVCVVDNNFYFSAIDYSSGRLALTTQSQPIGTLLFFKTR